MGSLRAEGPAMSRGWLDRRLIERDDALLDALVGDEIDLTLYLARVLLEELGYDVEPDEAPLALARVVACSLSSAKASGAARSALRRQNPGASGVLHA